MSLFPEWRGWRTAPASVPPMTHLPGVPEPSPEARNRVVVLTTPDGRQELSHASLLTERAAQEEAEVWRKTRHSLGDCWGAEVREVR